MHVQEDVCKLRPRVWWRPLKTVDVVATRLVVQCSRTCHYECSGLMDLAPIEEMHARELIQSAFVAARCVAHTWLATCETRETSEVHEQIALLLLMQIAIRVPLMIAPPNPFKHTKQNKYMLYEYSQSKHVASCKTKLATRGQ